MSATKAYIMGDAARVAHARASRSAWQQWINLRAACALARGVDTSVLAEMQRAVSREMQAIEELAGEP